MRPVFSREIRLKQPPLIFLADAPAVIRDGKNGTSAGGINLIAQRDVAGFFDGVCGICDQIVQNLRQMLRIRGNQRISGACRCSRRFLPRGTVKCSRQSRKSGVTGKIVVFSVMSCVSSRVRLTKRSRC